MSDPTNHSLQDSLAAHRLLDANLNRAQEALRTLEDIARFRDLSSLQSSYKTLRHALAAATGPWNVAELLRARNAHADVGREFKTVSEGVRSQGFSSIALAAGQRVQQALRCLEEGAKFQYPSTAPSVENIRYQVYDLNASLQIALQRDTQFLRNARLYCLADCSLPLDDFKKRVRSLALGGADIVQVREKQKDAQEIIEYVQSAMDVVSDLEAKIVVNDRADICSLTSAYGLHVGQTDLSVQQARKIISTSAVVGLSTHDVAQVQEAVRLGADYIGCGPTFPSKTKSFESFSGLDFLRDVASIIDQSELPAFAIGGIDITNLDQVLTTGIQRVVVGSALWRSKSPETSTREIKSMLKPID